MASSLIRLAAGGKVKRSEYGDGSENQLLSSSAMFVNHDFSSKLANKGNRFAGDGRGKR